MGKPTGFIEHGRELPVKRPVNERIHDYREIPLPFPKKKLEQQASRCMDCGTPFCTVGCPLGNVIPDWNDLVYRKDWRGAFERLRATNNFPEITGRICPAPCESSCVLGINQPPVTICQIEREIAEYAFKAGWVQPRPPVFRTGKHVAVVGSGPAGLACADQLNQAGHFVTVFERDDRIGGLLRYGIPDFKLEKRVLGRRLDIMETEGITFLPGTDIGANVPVEALETFDAVVLCIGATKPRDLQIPGRDLQGIYFAFDFLSQQNRCIAGDESVHEDATVISAEGKNVVVIGGGDTGSDCIGTARRQGARSITQFELLPEPPSERPAHQPWPFAPTILQTSTSHEEGVDRYWNIKTISFQGTNDHVERLITVNVEMRRGPNGLLQFDEVAGTRRTWEADLVLLAIGYTGPEIEGVTRGLRVRQNAHSTIDTTETYLTNKPGVFAAGDGRRGQSLVVWAISEGREAARAVDEYLEGHSRLPTKGPGDLPVNR